MATSDDKGTLIHAEHAAPPALPHERPTPALTMIAGLCLGTMLAWLITVILFAPPPRPSGIPAPGLILILIGAVLGLIVGGFAGVLARSSGRQA